MEKMKYDSLGVPVNNIDAIFIPIASSEEIPVVSSQLKYFNIQAQILGTGDWNDVGALDQSRQYSDGVIFFSDSYASPDSEAYRAFDAKYRMANNNKAPGANILYGYDAAKLVIHVISQGRSKRSDVAAALANIEGFEGLHSKISLSRIVSTLVLRLCSTGTARFFLSVNRSYSFREVTIDTSSRNEAGRRAHVLSRSNQSVASR